MHEIALTIGHLPILVSIVQNTVLAQDIWLEANNVLDDSESYGVNGLPPCSKPQPNVKGNHAGLFRTLVVLGCQAHIALIHLFVGGGDKNRKIDVEISGAGFILNRSSRM